MKITEENRPSTIPSWVNFSRAIGVELEPSFRSFIYFPIFTEKILVFDSKISNQIFDYVELEYLKTEPDFDEEDYLSELIPLDILVKKYWSSMKTLKEYMSNQHFEKPEVLIFEPVPKELINLK